MKMWVHTAHIQKSKIFCIQLQLGPESSVRLWSKFTYITYVWRPIYLKFLDGFSCYGTHLKAYCLLLDLPRFCKAESLSYWKIRLTRDLVGSVFIIAGIGSYNKIGVDASSLSTQFSVTVRLSFTKCRQIKDQVTSFQMSPITWKSTEELQIYWPSNKGDISKFAS